MICPHCEETIDDALLAKHLGAKGGRRPSVKITSVHARRMVAARERHRFAPGDTVLVVRHRKRARLVERPDDARDDWWMVTPRVNGIAIYHASELKLVSKLGTKPAPTRGETP